MYLVSLITAIAAGIALPFMDVIFGKFVTTFNNFAVGALGPDEYMSRVEKFTYVQLTNLKRHPDILTRLVLQSLLCLSIRRQIRLGVHPLRLRFCSGHTYNESAPNGIFGNTPLSKHDLLRL
jgi:ATP-binding cassette subfamily B (MDR/TAP) protein 1